MSSPGPSASWAPGNADAIAEALQAPVQAIPISKVACKLPRGDACGEEYLLRAGPS